MILNPKSGTGMALTMISKLTPTTTMKSMTYLQKSSKRWKTIASSSVTLDSSQMNSVKNSSSDAEQILIRNSEALDGPCTEITYSKFNQNND